MALASFVSRISDALGPLLGADVDTELVLAGKRVLLSAPDAIEHNPRHLAGFMFAVNLCARLYPKLVLFAPSRVRVRCEQLVKAINPHCEVDDDLDGADGALYWGLSPRCGSNNAPLNATTVSASQWTVLLNLEGSDRLHSTNTLTTFAAAAVGVAELFRQVFSEWIPNADARAGCAAFNLLTHDDSVDALPALPPEIDLGDVYLVGAGAIGQAAIAALATLPTRGTLHIVDPETIALSNLQRYVLAVESDVGASKCAIAARGLQGSTLKPVCIERPWSYDVIAPATSFAVCSAVDTADTRIAIQAALPRRIYNAWTQPDDLGWSRHEHFGDRPCLACLYWPTGSRPHYFQLVADALRQHPLRVLTYLTNKLPTDVPLQPEQVPTLPHIPKPQGVETWSERSILDDVATDRGVTVADLGAWRGRTLADLYHEGICAGALVRRPEDTLAPEVAVPLAHQSALAGVMLAAQLLFASVPELASKRPLSVEGRLDLLSPLPQLVSRPRVRSRSCLCSDRDFINRYKAKWGA